MHLHEDLTFIREAALRAVDPARLVREQLRMAEGRLWIGEHGWDLAELRDIRVIAAGKAAVPMAQAAGERLGTSLTAGVLVTKVHHTAGHPLPDGFQVFEAGHPTPDMNGVRAAHAQGSVRGYRMTMSGASPPVFGRLPSPPLSLRSGPML